MKKDELMKVINYMDEEPRRIDMNIFMWHHGEGEGVYKCESLPPCNTVGCIAGFTCLLNKLHDIPASPADLAQNFLELPNSRLFFINHWPTRFFNKYVEAKTPQEKADAIYFAARDYIKTGGWLNG